MRRWLGRLAAGGRVLLGIVGAGGMGLLVGLLVGAWKARAAVAAIPPRPPGPGPGFAPGPMPELEAVMIWGANLLVCGVIGLAAGLALAIVTVVTVITVRLAFALARQLTGGRSAGA